MDNSEVDSSLEKIFRKVEEESGRRAQDEAMDVLVDPVAEASGSTTRLRDRRRASVSISVFGQVHPSETSIGKGSNASMSTILSPLANAASKSAFYHPLMKPQSVDTLTSERSADDEIMSEDDHHHVTRMQTIAGRHNRILKTVDKVSALLSRNLSHSKRVQATTISIPPNGGDMVIGVSIEQAVEVDQDTSKRTTAYAEGSKHTLRSRASWLSMTGGASTGQGGLGRVFTQKFRRKSSANSDSVS